MQDKILILGGTGMLGHKAWQVFNPFCDTYVTVRGSLSEYKHYGIFDKKRTIDNVDVNKLKILSQVINKLKPSVVFNCIGVIKQSLAIENPLLAIEINSLLPHRLAKICTELGARLIHISTDCVFSGRGGRYTEGDISDAQDLYGRTKFLGEVSYSNALTLRTSMIGHEIVSKGSLLEWFLSQRGKRVKGYAKAIFSGFTTKALCDIILDIIRNHKGLTGIYHVSSEPIDKFTLLSLIKDIYKLDIEIESDDKFVCDRSLDSANFRNKTGFKPSDWRKMIVDMHEELTFYNKFRQ